MIKWLKSPEVKNFLFRVFVVWCFAVLLEVSIHRTGWIIMDFCQDHTAVQRFLSGNPIYEPLRCWNSPTYAVKGFNAHPPFSVLFFLPFAILSLNEAALLWLFISIGLYFLAGIITLKALGQLTSQNVFVFSVGSIFWNTYLASNSVHNIAQLLLFFVAASFYFYKKGKYEISGIFLGLASLFKVFPVLIILVALICKKYKMFKSSLLTILAGSAVSLVALGVDEHVRYITQVLPNEKYHYPDTTNMSLPGLVTRFITGFEFYKINPLINGYDFITGAVVGEILGITVLVLVIIYLYKMSKLSAHKYDEFIIYVIAPVLVQFVFPLSWGWGALITLTSMLIFVKYISYYRPKSFIWYIFLLIGVIWFVDPYSLLPYVEYGYLTNDQIVNTLLSGWATYSLGVFLVMLLLYLNTITRKKISFPKFNKED